MLGRLEFAPGGRGRAEEADLYGLRVLRARTDPEGFFRETRLRRAGRSFRRRGVVRLLVPESFARWPLMERLGLSPVDPGPLVRAQGAALALEALRRHGLEPCRATVALRGARADRDMRRTAERLCRSVRRLAIAAPRGGEELARRLHWEYGVPVLPAGERGDLALDFTPELPAWEGPSLALCGIAPKLDGLALSAPELGAGDREDLALLAALWEGGRLGERDITVK